MVLFWTEVKKKMTEKDQARLRSSPAARLRHIMSLHGFKNDYALSRATHVSRSTLRNILDKDRIGPKTAQKLAAIFGYDAAWIESGFGVPPGAVERNEWITDWDLIAAGLDPATEARKTTKNSVRERLRAIAEGRGLASFGALAVATGLPAETLKSALIRDELPPSLARTASDCLGVSQAWLLTGEGRPEPPGSELHGHAGFEGDRAAQVVTGAPIVSKAHINDPDAFALIPKASTTLSAGGGIVAEEGHTIECYAFRKDWLSSLGVHAQRAVLMDVDGDSMEPDLCHGDTVLIDLNRTKLRDGRIYVIAIGEVLAIKRLDLAGPDKIRVISTNPLYTTLVLAAEDVRIMGQAVWTASVLI